MAKISKIGIKRKSDIARKYPNAGLASDICVPKEDAIWLPSRNIGINEALGGGILYGRMLELAGEESSGKTLLALDFLSVAQALGGVGLFVDAERAFTAGWAIQNGVNLEKVYILPEISIEKIGDWIGDMVLELRKVLVNNEPIVLIIDSLAALDCEQNMDSTLLDSKAEMGNRAKAIYKMIRLRNPILDSLGICTICINQLRAKVGASMYEEADTTPGGGAMKFFASQRVFLYRGKQIKGGTKTNPSRLGNEVSFRVHKNKIAPPKPSFHTKVYFTDEAGDDIGYDKYNGLNEVFLRLQVVEKRGNAVYFGEDKVASSMDNFDEVIRTNSKLRKSLIAASGINTLSKTRKQLENTTNNLYSVANLKTGADEEE